MKPADFLIIDGSSMLVRAFFANAYGRAQSLTADGLPINAVFGFFNMLTSALDRVRPSHALVAWDVSRNTFRRQLYPQYKGTRGELPDELHPQFGIAQNLLAAIGMRQHLDERFEADDIIGTVSHLAANQGLEVIVLTGDRDALQLVRDRVTVAVMKKGVSEVELYTPEVLSGQYGLTPEQMIDLKGLMGDASDNIPGIPGIGEKTARKLLASFGTLENVLANSHALSGKLRDRVEQYADQAMLSKQLATIVRDMPVEFAVDDCRLQISVDRATAQFEALRLKRFLDPLRRLSAV